MRVRPSDRTRIQSYTDGFVSRWYWAYPLEADPPWVRVALISLFVSAHATGAEMPVGGTITEVKRDHSHRHFKHFRRHEQTYTAGSASACSSATRSRMISTNWSSSNGFASAAAA